MDDYKTEYDPEWVLATLNDAKEAAGKFNRLC